MYPQGFLLKRFINITYTIFPAIQKGRFTKNIGKQFLKLTLLFLLQINYKTSGCIKYCYCKI